MIIIRRRVQLIMQNNNNDNIDSYITLCKIKLNFIHKFILTLPNNILHMENILIRVSR